MDESSASGRPLAAISVTFQTTARRASRFVVPTSRIRPFAYSPAIAVEHLLRHRSS